MSALEVAAVAVTLLAVCLTTRQVIWCWPLSMLSVALYAVVFWQARLYAEVGLQTLYFGLSAYGWWAWRCGGRDRGELAVSRVTPGRCVGVLTTAALAGTALGIGLARLTDAALPLLDSWLAAFSIAAQWMQTRKLLEAWLLWIAVDVFYVGMFAYKELYLTAALYGAFLYLAALGYHSWRSDLAGGEAQPASGTA